MGLFSLFRNKSTATSATPPSSNSSSSSPEQDDEVQRELRHIEESERKQQRAAEKAREREAKQILKDRKKQQQAIAKQRKKEQDAIKNAQKREQRQLEKEQKRVVNERKRAEKRIKQAEKESKRAAKQELDAMAALVRQTRKESRKKEKKAKQQVYRSKRALKAQERARKRVLRQQQKEEKKRHQRQVLYANEQRRLEEELEHHRMELAQSTVVIAVEEQPEDGNVAVTKQAPPFKERLYCTGCHIKFVRVPTRFRHHCRNCGDSFCNSCLSTSRRPMPWIQLDTPQRICMPCEDLVMRGIQEAAPAVTNQEVARVEEDSVTIQPRSLSLSDQPVSESVDEETPSPTSSSRRVRIRLRSRSSGSSKSGKKTSIWNLPIRPLLKRKESVDQLRNRAWDLDLQLEKAAQVAKMSSNARVLGMTPLQPSVATAS